MIAKKITLKKIGILTSGGDAPGMNACIRAVVRTALFHKIECIGFKRGYEGLIHNDHLQLDHRSVANIIQRGGTILKTARSKAFETKNGLLKAKETLLKNKIDGLIVIGGDGTFKGALALSKIAHIPIVGCPGTIDNDLVGTDFTIGYDTAINTVIEATDKIRDTAESHSRIFIVEVMGRDAGLIALRSGIASGAEAILVPERKEKNNDLIAKLKRGRADKFSKIIMVAEGDESGGAIKVAEFLKKNFPLLDIKVTILGHIQRGGSPTCMDRVNASRIGYHAVQALLEKKKGIMVGIINGKISFTPLEMVIKHIQSLPSEMFQIAEVLSK